MSPSSNDPNTPDAKSVPESTEPPIAEKTTPGAVGRGGQAALLAAALAVVGAAQADAAVAPAEPDRAHLEALLHGSWTQPADLSARAAPSDPEAEPVRVADEFSAAFNDSYNPNPKPYHDKTYADSGFGDRN
jgi:hypothetical protein